ncbi:MAG: mechanosensitive ion channel family protein [Ignavibacteriales bacterium]|nr:mechanosensitive ion channel family protein [Ignavibacteriales bacterium]
MIISKNKIVTVSLVLFSITLFSIISGFFKISSSINSGLDMDGIFYYSTNIILWLSGALLFNTFMHKIIWGKIFKTSAGSKTLGLIEDLTVTLIYLIALWIIIVEVFDQPLTSSLAVTFLILLVVITYLRPKILKYFSKEFISTTRPFKIGDWIKLINKNGIDIIFGEVIHFDRMAIQLKSERDTFLLFPNNLLDEFIIENYSRIKKENRFSVVIKLNSGLSIERVKRILFASTKQAILELNNHVAAQPQIIVGKMMKNTIEYKVNFWIIPWKPNSPEIATDFVLTQIINNLKIAGIRLGAKTDEPETHIIENVALFDSLSEEELEKLHTESKREFYTERTTIIRQGEKGNSMYILAEGLLKVFIKADKNTDEEIEVGMITPGQFFGEMSLFTGEERSATILTETDSIVVEITKDSLKKILENRSELVNEFAKIIAERQSGNIQKLERYKIKDDSFIKKIIVKIKSFFEL